MHTLPCQVIRLDAPSLSNHVFCRSGTGTSSGRGVEYSEVVRSGLQLRCPDRQFFIDSPAVTSRDRSGHGESRLT